MYGRDLHIGSREGEVPLVLSVQLMKAPTMEGQLEEGIVQANVTYPFELCPC